MEEVWCLIHGKIYVGLSKAVVRGILTYDELMRMLNVELRHCKLFTILYRFLENNLDDGLVTITKILNYLLHLRYNFAIFICYLMEQCLNGSEEP